MKVNIQSLHFDADIKLLEFIENKITKLGQVSDAIISADVTLRLEKSDIKENKLVEISINVPGSDDIFSRKQGKTFEEAVDEASQALRRQLKKLKGKQKNT